MRYLLINTAVSVSTVVLIENNQVISIAEEFNSNDLSSKIFFMIDKVFEEGKCAPKDLNKIFVVNGPGSFTGIRIGLAIAKTMAWALQIDLIPVSSLELFATTPVSTDFIASMVDARRNCVYAGIYNQKLESILEDQYVDLDTILKKVKLLGNTTFVSYDKFDELSIINPKIDYIKIIHKHENDMVENCHKINPVYLKLTEAEEKRNLNEY